MRALCKTEPASGAHLLTDVPVPTPASDEILFRVEATAICGTDQHIMNWEEYARLRIRQFPFIFGHETAGEVIEVGRDVTRFKPGDRISVETHIPCGRCFACRSGNPHICENLKVFGVTEPGAFAEYAKVPESVAVHLPDAISYEEGAMLEPMGVGVHGVEVADVYGKTVLVNGCGPIGLMAIGAAKVKGASKVFASDLFDNKLRLAEEIGADAVVNSWEKDVRKFVQEQTNGIGVDAVIDVAGVKSSIVSGLRSLHKGGLLVSVGLPNGEIPLNLSEDIIYREIIYTGVSGRLMFQTWEDCLDIMQNPNFSLKPAMGKMFILDEWDDAFQAIKDGVPGKIILHP